MWSWNITQEVSKGFKRDAVLWVTARQSTDIWGPVLCRITHDFQTTFPDSLPITPPTYTICHPKCNLQPKHKHGIDRNIIKPLPIYHLVLPCPAQTTWDQSVHTEIMYTCQLYRLSHQGSPSSIIMETNSTKTPGLIHFVLPVLINFLEKKNI